MARGRSGRRKPKRSGAATRLRLSTCCRGRGGRGICLRERSGATSRAPIFQAAPGCPTPATANSRPAWPAISPTASKRRPMATMPGRSSCIAWRIAGCRGTPPSARSRSAIPTSRGIAKAPTAGSPPAFRCRRIPRRNRVRANRRSLRLRAGVQAGLHRGRQIEQSLLAQHPHVAVFGGRFPPVLENPGLPAKLAGELVHRSLIRVRLVLQVPPLLGRFADTGRGFLFLARKALDSVHHLVALGVELRIQRDEQRLCLLLFFFL